MSDPFEPGKTWHHLLRLAHGAEPLSELVRTEQQVVCGSCGCSVPLVAAEWIDREEAGLSGYWLCRRCEGQM